MENRPAIGEEFAYDDQIATICRKYVPTTIENDSLENIHNAFAQEVPRLGIYQEWTKQYQVLGSNFDVQFTPGEPLSNIAFGVERKTMERPIALPPILAAVSFNFGGKTTFVEMMKLHGYLFVPQWTTRAMRVNAGEIQGWPYNFVEEDYMDKHAERELFKVVTRKGSYRSGLPKEEFLEAVSTGLPVIIDQNIESWNAVRHVLDDMSKKGKLDADRIRPIFLLPPNPEKLAFRTVKRALTEAGYKTGGSFHLSDDQHIQITTTLQASLKQYTLIEDSMQVKDFTYLVNVDNGIELLAEKVQSMISPTVFFT